MGNLGFGGDHAAILAAEKGDFGPLEEALKALGDKAKGFDKYLALAKSALEGKSKAAAERLAKDQAAVHEAVGGKENWEAIAEWARSNAEPAEKEAVNAALRAGGIAAKAMAVYLNSLHQKAAGVQVNPAPAVQRTATPAATVSSGPVTAREFSTESASLRSKLGPNFEASPQFAVLVARREAARKQGL